MRSVAMVDLERFRVCCEAYGAERRRWPVGDQAVFERVALTREGQALLALAERDDGFLDAYAVDGPSEALRQRIGTRAPTPALPQGGRGQYRGAVVVLVVSAVVGFAVGYAQVRGAEGGGLSAQSLLLGPSDLGEVGL